MDFSTLVSSRHSIRSFRPTPIEDQALERILDAANLAPSAGDLQAYEIILVRDPAIKAKLSAGAHGQDFIKSAPVVLMFCANPERSAAKYGKRGAELYCLQDATIAAAYAQLAATEQGLGSVWIGALDEPALQDVTGGLRPICILPLGYPAARPDIASRRGRADLVHFEKLRAA